MSTQIWAAAVILEKIRQMNKEGVDLRHGMVYPDNKRLVSAAVRHFGSWRAAVTAAGVDYERIRQRAEKNRAQKIQKWSKKKIIAGIKEVFAAGEPLTATSVRKTRSALFSAAVSPRYFGNWRAAVSAAGIDYAAVLAQSRANNIRTDSRRRRSTLAKIRLLDRNVLLLPAENIVVRYPNLFKLASELFESWEEAVRLAFLLQHRNQRL